MCCEPNPNRTANPPFETNPNPNANPKFEKLANPNPNANPRNGANPVSTSRMLVVSIFSYVSRFFSNIFENRV